jgi:predicted metalloendopeptidase
MRWFRLWLAFCLVVTAAGWSQSAASDKPGAGFSIENIDKNVDPCVDFYQYACGNWIKNSEIPADRPAWRSFSELNESNLGIERQILEKATGGGVGRTAIDQKIGDLYGSCMDEKAADAKGIAPLKPELEHIAAVNDKGALIDEIAHIHLTGPNPLFNFYSASDLHNADQVIAYVGQGGLSLPDRDYYIKDDADKVEMRKHLVEYAGRPESATGSQFGRNRAAGGNPAGGGLDGPHQDARPQESRPQDDSR